VVILSDVEARDLVQTVMEAVAAIEDGDDLRRSWPGEATDWCLLILDRLQGG
jgi:hypothetical protein